LAGLEELPFPSGSIAPSRLELMAEAFDPDFHV